MILCVAFQLFRFLTLFRESFDGASGLPLLMERIAQDQITSTDGRRFTGAAAARIVVVALARRMFRVVFAGIARVLADRIIWIQHTPLASRIIGIGRTGPRAAADFLFGMIVAEGADLVVWILIAVVTRLARRMFRIFVAEVAALTRGMRRVFLANVLFPAALRRVGVIVAVGFAVNVIRVFIAE